MSIHGICFGRRGIGASLRPGLPRTGNAAHSARCLLPALLTVLCTVPVASPGADGGALYARHCAQCHDNAQGRVPARAHLEGLPPRAIVRALETGSMRVIGTFALSGPDRTAIAAYLAGSPPGEATEPA
ncbi:MAG: c-type cytochrome, partial [Gammaproteobacteria bacterium]|nr:c-type cytochrome [Gammaproteobacteria bacterium]